MTATGCYNLWDEIILREELRFLQAQYGESAHFTIFTHDKKSALFDDKDVSWITYFPHGIFKNPLGNIWYLIRNIVTIWRSDILIVGGGGLLFDNEEWVSFGSLINQWYFRTKIARLAGTTIVYLGISLEIKQVKNKMALRKLFQKGDFIIVRDEKSAGLLEALEVPCSQIPDIAFLLVPEKIEKKPEKKRVGISVRGGFLGESEVEIPLIYEYLVNKGYDPVFLIHTTKWYESQNDALFIKRVMSGKTYNTTGTLEQTLKVYPSLYAVVGMRYHSAVLACIHSLPFIMVSYGPKTEELMNFLDNKGYTIPPEDLSVETFSKMWEDLERLYGSLEKNMTERYTTIHEETLQKLSTL